MPDCSSLAKCPFFHDRLANMPKVAELYKKSYCKTDCSSCARYQYRTAVGKPPPDGLMSNQADVAARLIAEARAS